MELDGEAILDFAALGHSHSPILPISKGYHSMKLYGINQVKAIIDSATNL
jgi:hypothetical protein